MGIANTLSLSLRERTRELGLLRAVGLTRSQLRATVRWESLIIAGFGALGGIAVGVLVGWGLTRSFSGDLPLDVFSAPAGRLLLVAGGRRCRRDPRRGASGAPGRQAAGVVGAGGQTDQQSRWMAASIRPPHSWPTAHSSGSGLLSLWAAVTSTVPEKQRPTRMPARVAW